MATLVLDDGIFTAGLPTAAAFLMRVSMSAMGSVMLIDCYLLSAPISVDTGLGIRDSDSQERVRFARESRIPNPGFRLPGRLAQAGNVAAHGRLAQLVAAQAELRVHGARAAGQGAAGGLAGGRGVTRQLLQLDRRFHLLVVARVL